MVVWCFGYRVLFEIPLGVKGDWGVTSPRVSSSSRANGADEVRARSFWDFGELESFAFGVLML